MPSADFAEQLARDWRASPLDEQERAMLTFVEQLTLDPGLLSEADLRPLREVGFGDEDILAITVICAWYNFVSRLACALGVELDPEKQESPVLRGLSWRATAG
ncbi:MAG: hypothetical protein HY329_24760 [Chloroflexi bacterium]|nr:hypothetical protein [Chloroflexota bacterium]